MVSPRTFQTTLVKERNEKPCSPLRICILSYVTAPEKQGCPIRKKVLLFRRATYLEIRFSQLLLVLLEKTANAFDYDVTSRRIAVNVRRNRKPRSGGVLLQGTPAFAK
jgi:hypothetical protein